LSDEKRVIAALKHLGEGRDLEQYVDVDAVLRYFAAHTGVVSLDSYISSQCHNYCLYENGGRISILPWDYNMAFGGFQAGNASDVVNFPSTRGIGREAWRSARCLNKLLEVPEEYKETYHEYLQESWTGIFSDGRFDRTGIGSNDL
jgi:spore coat protein CotH